MYIEYKQEAHMVFDLTTLPDFVNEHIEDDSVYFREFATYIVFRDKAVNKKEPLYACYVNKHGVLIYPTTGTLQTHRGIYLQLQPDEELDHIASNIGLTPTTNVNISDYPFTSPRRTSPVYQHIRKVPPADHGTSSKRPHFYLLDGKYYRTTREAAATLGIDSSLIGYHAQARDRKKGKYITHYQHVWTLNGVQHECYMIEEYDPRYKEALKQYNQLYIPV